MVRPEVPTHSIASGLYLLTDPDLVRMSRSYFRQAWTLGRPLAGTINPDSYDRMRSIARLLSAGTNDESAAKQLNVSTRTYQRYVAFFLQTLGARNRFDAGVRAVDAGWIETPKLPET